MRDCAGCWVNDDTIHVTDRPVRGLDPLAAPGDVLPTLAELAPLFVYRYVHMATRCSDSGSAPTGPALMAAAA